MKEMIFGLLFVFGYINFSAQVVANIRAKQLGQEIVVFYSVHFNFQVQYN